jgi:hypothetical protein
MPADIFQRRRLFGARIGNRIAFDAMLENTVELVHVGNIFFAEIKQFCAHAVHS